MNFRTTILLLVVLAAAATLYIVTSRKGSTDDQAKTEPSGKAGKKVVDVASTGNVNRVVVTRAGGERLALERGAGASEWRIAEPVKGAAESFKVDDLLREVIELRTTGTTAADGKGLDKPQYVIELTDKDNKTTKLNVGSRSSVGDILYVRVGDAGEASVVSSSIVTQLEKPASEYRKSRLLTTPSDKITGVTVAHGNQTLKLAKSADNAWQITEPKQMPGDETQISTLLSAITGLDAVEFVAEDASDPAEFGLNKPQMTVSFTTAPPTTQPTTKPSTTKPADDGATIKFGRPSDALKTHVYAIASSSGPVVTVDATRLDAFKKTPLDLRDRKVLDVDPNAVSKLSISIDKPATTQPTTQPASKQNIVLERRSETAAAPAPAPAAPAPAPAPTPTPEPSKPAQPQSRVKSPDGGATVSLAAFQDKPAPAPEPAKDAANEKPAPAPATAVAGAKPATAPAAPATQPAMPKTKWLLVSEPKGDANDFNVQALLDTLRSLRAEKFLEKFPTTQATPAATYVVRVNTRSWADDPAKECELKITDPGGDAKLVGQLGDLAFELDRAILEKLTAEFTAPKIDPAGPLFGPPTAPPARPSPLPPFPPAK